MSWYTVLHPDLLPQLKEILSTAPSDFTANLEGSFSPKDLEEILTRAHTQLFNELQAHPVNTGTGLARTWNRIVVDFYQHNYWQHEPMKASKVTARKPTRGSQLATYLRMFLVPTLILKGGILYFGVHYSTYPGEGYGWGLIIAIILIILNFGLFLWKTRNDQED